MSRPRATRRARRAIAVLVPCYNEALTVAKVIADFRAALPGCVVYVYDNRSTDGTGDIARDGRRGRAPRGASGQGRRHAPDVRRDRCRHLRRDRRRRDLRRDARAGDGRAARRATTSTWSPACATTSERDAAYRRGHQFGNRAFNVLLGMLFGERPDRHVLRLSRDVAAVREVVSRGGARLRDRDRAHRARAGIARAHRPRS